MLSTVRLFKRHYHLTLILVLRDIKSRYVGSAMGFFWAVINPLILLCVFTFVFSTIFKQRVGVGGEENFFLFMFCGLWPWFAFSEGVSRSSYAIIENAHIIKKVVFPSEILVIATVLSSFVQQVIGFLLFFALLLVMGQLRNPLYLLLLPAVFVLQLAFSVGLGWLLSSLTVFVRDVAQVTSACLLVWLYMTPIFYTANLVPPAFRFLLVANPMHHLLSIYRSLILGGHLPDLAGVLYVGLIATGALWLGSRVFGHLKATFADLL
jgi:ABC-type polysaccharide/polyol phosphate export permease